MIKKIIAFTCLAWAIATILSASDAQAVVAIPGEALEAIFNEEGVPEFEKINVTGKVISDSFEVCVPSRFHANFQQIMAIPGVGAVWVYTDQAYSTGPKEAALFGTCKNEEGDHFYLYELGPCACLRPPAVTRYKA